MSLGDLRRHYRGEALEVAAELIRQFGSTEGMAHLPEDHQKVFDEECIRLANSLDKKAKKYKASK